jgi:hypothetical protein
MTFCLAVAGTYPPQVDLSAVLSGVALAKTEALAKADGDVIPNVAISKNNQ